MTDSGRFTRLIWGNLFDDVAAPIELRAASIADGNLNRLRAEVPEVARLFHAITFTAALHSPQAEHELINAYIEYVNLPYPRPNYRDSEELFAGIPARHIWPDTPFDRETWVASAVQWAYGVEEVTADGWSLVASGCVVQVATPADLAPHLLTAWREAVPDTRGLRVCFWSGLVPYAYGIPPEHIITAD